MGRTLSESRSTIAYSSSMPYAENAGIVQRWVIIASACVAVCREPAGACLTLSPRGSGKLLRRQGHDSCARRSTPLLDPAQEYAHDFAIERVLQHPVLVARVH